MTYEELVKALGLDTEESKDKAVILKKEYNAYQKEIKDLTDNVTELTATIEADKVVAEKFNSVVNAFGLDINAKDFDENIENAKETIIKEAGGGSTPEEIKELKLSKTKAERENKKMVEQIAELTTQLEAEKTQRINNVKRDAIHKAVVKNNLVDPETSIDLFLNLAQVDEDGKTVTMTMPDGSVLPIVDGIADWAKEHPAFVSKKVQGGAGSGSNGNGFDGGKFGEVSPFMQSLVSESLGNGEGGSKASLESMFG